MIPILLAAIQAAPALARFLGGGDSTTRIAEKVAEVASAVVGTSNPQEAIQKILANEELKQKFQLEVTKQYMDWEQLFLADVQNARDRDVKLAQAGFRNSRANWLTIFAICLVVGLIAVIILRSGLDEWVKGVLLVALGRAWGYLDAIFNFEFGTTKHSAAKDQTIADLAKKE